MRCTKCHYLSFEPEPRCKNCGHDLSIDDMYDPLADFDLDRGPGPMPDSGRTATATASRHSRSYDSGVATMTPPAEAVASIAQPVLTSSQIMTSELPLFVRDMPDGLMDDEEDMVPLVKVPARPRTPLAVRRTTPDPAKLRAKYAPRHEPDLLDEVDDLSHTPLRPTAMHDEPVLYPAEPVAPTVILAAPVELGSRFAAAAIDAALLGSIAAVVVVFTLQLAELPVAQVLELPAIPMLAFFALIALGYELLFTAAQGQTVGKMVMGLRVVSDDEPSEDRVSVKQAAVRALSLLPLGAGLVAALVGQRQAVHDRLAHTRVVRA
jgi:uncharacterized RDD family membrane protein YckC